MPVTRPNKVQKARSPHGAGAFDLGLDVTNPIDVHRELLAGLPFSSLAKFERASKLTWSEIARIIGVPARTLARRKQKKTKFRPDESERLYRLASLYRLAIELFDGDEAAAKHWLESPRKAFGGASGFELARTEVGARRVESLIHQLENGVFA